MNTTNTSYYNNDKTTITILRETTIKRDLIHNIHLVLTYSTVTRTHTIVCCDTNYHTVVEVRIDTPHEREAIDYYDMLVARAYRHEGVNLTVAK